MQYGTIMETRGSEYKRNILLERKSLQLNIFFFININQFCQ
jgi:hypothetical protein